MSNKNKAEAFFKMAGQGEVRMAYEKFIDANFKHHNQYFKGDRESLMLAMEEAHKVSPNKSIKVMNIFEEGDRVFTHSLVEKADKEIAVVHIFKFAGEKVIELWDLGQIIEKNSPNENGLF